MGLPIGLWCTENLSRITTLWGKLIKQDDRTEEPKSFTTARVIIDSFQWETIHEWVTLRVDGRSFDVFLKEFGSEVYSVQAHPNLWEDLSGTRENSSDNGGGSVSVVEETPADSDSAPATVGVRN
ncbi:hypothetical protein PIB30_015104 [Stylosanthes scabra]|uniref:Uncharacterized protein n=1 Tax=Stylosanthes scabra TaxID=79078 RepID=A0ABU6R777_9FABA|nr:hypothetical protein [Stylosanthes scabra]